MTIKLSQEEKAKIKRLYCSRQRSYTTTLKMERKLSENKYNFLKKI